MSARRAPARGFVVLLAAVLAPADAAGPDAVAASSLTLAEALKKALTASPTLSVAALAPAAARAAVDRERAAWDPSVSATLGYRDDSLPATSNVNGVNVQETNARSADLGLVKPMRDGSSLEARWIDERTLTNSRRATFNPAYETAVSVTWRRPLRRGGDPRVNRRGLDLASLDLTASEHRLRAEAIAVLAATERAYWDLAAARGRAEAAEVSLGQARTFLEDNRFRARAGAVAAIAVIESEAAVAERRDAEVVAARDVRTAGLRLMGLVHPPVRPTHPVPDLADLPGAALPPLPDFEALLGRALEANPDYRIALADLEARNVALAFARNEFLPRLDLVATLTTNGLSGTRPRALDRAGTLDFPGYFVGLSFDLPLGRRAARAETDRTRLEVERAIRSVKAVEVDLENALAELHGRYELDLARLPATAERAEAAARKADGEEERYRGGFIPADDVLRAQRELADARAADVSARAQVAISAVELWAAAGILPEERGVALGGTVPLVDGRSDS